MGLGVEPQQEHFIPSFMFGSSISSFLDWRKIVTCIIILTFFLENCNLIINWLFSDATCHYTERPHSVSPFDQIWRQRTKISILKFFSEFGKIWKCNLGFSKIPITISFMNWEKLGNIHIHRPTFQNPNIESVDELGKLMSQFKLHCWK